MTVVEVDGLGHRFERPRVLVAPGEPPDRALPEEGAMWIPMAPLILVLSGRAGATHAPEPLSLGFGAHEAGARAAPAPAAFGRPTAVLRLRAVRLLRPVQLGLPTSPRARVAELPFACLDRTLFRKLRLPRFGARLAACFCLASSLATVV
eukprot:CAMPEP_0182543658 /NCGR_PEP_ID=MMETSP1323-20130603/32001_1 /TAXON_ID=236787 /ORGANISM="Florenciella parvula, Strain RCC1693" /LENGTH=149 /DNA_ID=CAMNT_0024754617 /DNA_START=36 /DNA_END=486 /DNA_ORIENTATION=-